MTRQQAIDAIRGAWLQRDSEFCVGSEHESSQRELDEALKTLDESARQAEREACAAVAEEHKPSWVSPSAGEDYIGGNPMEDIAEAIRKRGQQ